MKLFSLWSVRLQGVRKASLRSQHGNPLLYLSHTSLRRSELEHHAKHLVLGQRPVLAGRFAVQAFPPIGFGWKLAIDDNRPAMTGG